MFFRALSTTFCRPTR